MTAKKPHAPAKRQAWIYQRPEAPPLGDLFRGGGRGRAARKYHLSGNVMNGIDLAVHFGLKLLPASACSAIGAALGNFVMPRWHQGALRKARRNLESLLPDLSEAEREAILKRNCENQGRIMTEFSVIPRLARSPRVTWHNEAVIKEAHEKGPVIIVGLHLGNWEIMAPKLIDMGFRPSANYTPPNGRARAWIAEQVRLRLGYGLMPPGKDGIRPALNILKNGGMISIFCDEGVAGKIRGPFLGRAPHLQGNLAIAVRLARMTGATLCPMHTLRRDGVSFDGHALPPIVLPPEDKPGSRLMDDVILLNSVIEPVIRAHLDQWYFLDCSL